MPACCSRNGPHSNELCRCCSQTGYSEINPPSLNTTGGAVPVNCSFSANGAKKKLLPNKRCHQQCIQHILRRVPWQPEIMHAPPLVLWHYAPMYNTTSAHLAAQRRSSELALARCDCTHDCTHAWGQTQTN